MKNSTLPLQTVIEYVEALAPEDQDLLIELIQKRQIAQRRAEIAQNAERTIRNWKAGKAQCGSLNDLFQDRGNAEALDSIVTALPEFLGCPSP